ncbi:hypothetical protein [Amycolatopsis keratiniphila]|uniref:hypothetical protein n=1 Tax=Amycolatopsis keratiniphila TaxID=129921 RepID=UPI000879B95A|nr:hypothetical protein [Amycolatopsis keratiniphila]OLZ42939.1 hypothetical protein BS330_43335 [Amycolatopsis keratiniphila subsp. nogabecina]SDU66291.1 hypothetical protein SAMN04489733_7917 [Amycolatopsis keratiniphila]
MTRARDHTAGRARLAWVDRIDAPAAVRGASSGFSVLIIGGLAQPLAVTWVQALGYVWLPLIAVIAFIVAARKIGNASLPAAHGAVAALCSYLLALPLSLLVPTGRDPLQIGLTAATAIVVGAVVGLVRGRMSRSVNGGTSR